LPNINVIPACASVDFAGRSDHARKGRPTAGRQARIAGQQAGMLITLEGNLLKQSRGWLCTTKYVNGLMGVRVYTLKRDDCR